MNDSNEPRPTSSLAERVDRLFRTVTKPGGEEYSYNEVSDMVREKVGASISGPYLQQLRSGRRDNPTLHQLEVLAEFFGVPTSYFTDDAMAERVDAQLKLLAAMRDAKIQSIATRAFEGNLSPQGLDTLSDLLDNLLGMQPPRRPRRGRPRKVQPPSQKWGRRGAGAPLPAQRCGERTTLPRPAPASTCAGVPSSRPAARATPPRSTTACPRSTATTCDGARTFVRTRAQPQTVGAGHRGCQLSASGPA